MAPKMSENMSNVPYIFKLPCDDLFFYFPNSRARTPSFSGHVPTSIVYDGNIEKHKYVHF